MIEVLEDSRLTLQNVMKMRFDCRNPACRRTAEAIANTHARSGCTAILTIIHEFVDGKGPSDDILFDRAFQVVIRHGEEGEALLVSPTATSSLFSVRTRLCNWLNEVHAYEGLPAIDDSRV